MAKENMAKENMTKENTAKVNMARENMAKENMAKVNMPISLLISRIAPKLANMHLFVLSSIPNRALLARRSIRKGPPRLFRN